MKKTNYIQFPQIYIIRLGEYIYKNFEYDKYGYLEDYRIIGSKYLYERAGLDKLSELYFRDIIRVKKEGNKLQFLLIYAKRDTEDIHRLEPSEVGYRIIEIPLEWVTKKD